MIKKMLATLLAMATVFSMTACGGGKQEAPAAKNPPAQESAEKDTSAASKFSEKYTWSLVTTYATNTPVVNGYFLFAEKLSEYTDGAVTLNVFPNGQLMNENDSFLGLKSGDVEFAGYGPTPYNLFVPEYGFVFAPFLIPDYESFQKLYSSDLLEESKKILRTKHNTRDLAGMAYRGYRNMSSNKPIKSVEDLKNLKLRMNDNILWSDTWNSMGAISIPISLGELYTSIQNGAVEASEGPWEQIAGIHLEEVQKYAVLTKHYSEIAGIWMANDLYESLPENYKAAVDKAGAEAIAFMTKEAKVKEEEYRQQLLKGGCEYLEADTSGFQKLAEETWKEYFEKHWVSSLEEVQSIINK